MEAAMTAPAPFDVEDLIRWRRLHAHPGSLAWGQCRSRSWALDWPESGPHPVIAAHRPSALRLSRRGPCTCSPEPPTVQSVSDHLCLPPEPRRFGPQAASHRWRHWRWWRTRARIRRIRRGDIAPVVAPPPQPPLPDPYPHRLYLLRELDYVTLIEAAARAGDGFWLLRFRLRRRRVRIMLTPPRTRLGRLAYAHKRRGDLTWAPRPPAVASSGLVRVKVHLQPPSYHFAGSWLLRGGGGPMPRGHHPLPPPRRR
jgi:hypothetical protein